MNRFHINIILIGLISIVLLFSCRKDPLQEKYPNVDPALWIYFESFEAAALERGIAVDLSNITGSIRNIAQANVAGSCAYGGEGHNQVVIDLPYWNAVSDLEREYVVYHELGHCELLRDHRDDADQNGECISIMYSGLGACDDNYSEQTRESLLDELFQ